MRHELCSGAAAAIAVLVAVACSTDKDELDNEPHFECKVDADCRVRGAGAGEVCLDHRCVEAPPDPGGCGEMEITCVDCGGDVLFPGVCVDGEWRCTGGHVRMEECPPDTCWGPLQLDGKCCRGGTA